jgi:hypothetical protein
MKLTDKVFSYYLSHTTQTLPPQPLSLSFSLSSAFGPMHQSLYIFKATTLYPGGIQSHDNSSSLLDGRRRQYHTRPRLQGKFHSIFSFFNGFPSCWWQNPGSFDFILFSHHSSTDPSMYVPTYEQLFYIFLPSVSFSASILSHDILVLLCTLMVVVARWFIFKPKIPIWVNFRGP